ncbi:4'-phosphopantetheinyl transferase superfamily protein [Candidatus Dependentiae bacterium]|jgi:phosphopantetheine--protein transferase-like protein|nr:4'-phosphopantetheinyl transferase superfamily protein [Candidatus Dependentiae bacterium]
MILGVGTDIVGSNRFAAMSTFSYDRLRTFFSEAELMAAQDPKNSKHFLPEKLATRFAAKEALFKALSATLVRLGHTQKTFSLRFLAQISSVQITIWGVPEFHVDCAALEQKIGVKLPSLHIHLSLSHEREHVLAFVVCELYKS